MSIMTALYCAITLIAGILIGRKLASASPAEKLRASADDILTKAATNVVEILLSAILPELTLQLKTVSAADIQEMMRERYKIQLQAIRMACFHLKGNFDMDEAILKASGLKFEAQSEDFTAHTNAKKDAA